MLAWMDICEVKSSRGEKEANLLLRDGWKLLEVYVSENQACFLLGRTASNV